MLLNFNLWNRRFIHEIKKGGDYRTLVFDATLEDHYELTVKGKGKLIKGIVRIQEGHPTDEIARITYIPSWTDRDTDSTSPHCFQIDTRIPPNGFQNLLSNNENNSLFQLKLDFETHDGNLQYGYAPDGSMVDWNVENNDIEVAQSATFACGSWETPSDDD